MLAAVIVIAASVAYGGDQQQINVVTGSITDGKEAATADGTVSPQ